MIIETKGTKTGEATETGAQKYALKEAARSSATPYYLALAVAAVAGYLKSLFQTPVHAEPEASAAGPEAKAAPKLVVIASSDVNPGETPDEHRLLGSSGVVPQAEMPSPEYDASHLQAHTLHFARHDPQPNLNDFKASPIIPRPINDNTDRAPGARGGGGGRSRDHEDGDGGAESESAETHVSRPPGGLGDTDDLPGSREGRPADTDRPAGQETAGPGKQTSGGDGEIGTGSFPAPGGDAGNGSGAVTPRPASNDDGDGPSGRRNRAPTTSGTVHLADVAACALLPIALADLLRNAQDPDGDSLSARNVTASTGSLARVGDGWVYDADGLGPVTLTYEVTDGELSVTQTALFDVVEQGPMVGTDGDDLLLGTLCADEIDGRDGNDNIDARAAADIIAGGAGDDHILGGAGNDVILGGDGNDVAFAGMGADRVSGGTGNDRLFGEEGDDILFGDAGDDLLDGGDGSDILVGGTGNDLLLGDMGDDRLDGSEGADVALAGAGRDVVSGGLGDDRLEGGDGDDVVDGGAGNDTLADGAGSDTVLGGSGDDVVLAALDGDADTYDGGAGIDILDVSGTTSGVVVDLDAGTSESTETGRDRIVSIEDVRGGSGADTLSGSAAAETISGGAGRDHVSGGAGNDVLDGGDGDDTIRDGDGHDVALGGNGDDLLIVSLDGEADTFDGGDGQDSLDLSGTRTGVAADLLVGIAIGAETGRDLLDGLEALIGGTGDDSLSGSDGSNRLAGGDGDDLIAGRGGDDVLDGGAGCDTLLDGAGCDTLRGGAEDDRIVLALDGDEDLVDGGEGSDTLDLSSATGDLLVDLVNQVVSGAKLGHDKVEAVERIVAGSGDDRFVIGDDDVVLTGGGGRDGYGFLPRSATPEPTRSVHITDFSVGDYVDLLRWSLFEHGAGVVGHSLSEAMDRDDGTISGIRYRAALFDGGDVTVISADLDGNDSFETTLVLDGHHTLLFVEKTAAATPPSTPIH